MSLPHLTRLLLFYNDAAIVHHQLGDFDKAASYYKVCLCYVQYFATRERCPVSFGVALCSKSIIVCRSVCFSQHTPNDALQSLPKMIFLTLFLLLRDIVMQM